MIISSVGANTRPTEMDLLFVYYEAFGGLMLLQDTPVSGFESDLELQSIRFTLHLKTENVAVLMILSQVILISPLNTHTHTQRRTFTLVLVHIT